MADDLKAGLLREEVLSELELGEALFSSVVRAVPFVRALTQAAGVSEETLSRYLLRTDAPHVEQVVPLVDVLAELPTGLPFRLFALPVRRDAVTGTVDIVVADVSDPHPAEEFAFHLGKPVRVVRASVTAIDDALASLRSRLGDTVERPSVTPPWGTVVDDSVRRGTTFSSLPRSSLGSEIPIPLMRRAFAGTSGGTERPPQLVDNVTPSLSPILSMMPTDEFSLQLRNFEGATGRDRVLEIALAAARLLSPRAALLVVRRGAYVGWACTPEFGEQAALAAISIPLDVPSVFHDAATEGLYFGGLRHDDVHAKLVALMGGEGRVSAADQFAAAPIRVGGKTAAVVLVDGPADRLLETKRLDELSRRAGRSLARVVQELAASRQNSNRK
jgi:hypothetical protein